MHTIYTLIAGLSLRPNVRPFVRYRNGNGKTAKSAEWMNARHISSRAVARSEWAAVVQVTSYRQYLCAWKPRRDSPIKFRLTSNPNRTEHRKNNKISRTAYLSAKKINSRDKWNKLCAVVRGQWSKERNAIEKLEKERRRQWRDWQRFCESDGSREYFSIFFFFNFRRTILSRHEQVFQRLIFRHRNSLSRSPNAHRQTQECIRICVQIPMNPLSPKRKEKKRKPIRMATAICAQIYSNFRNQ